MAVIYKITNTLNGKIYIGQTIQSLIKRFQGHKTEALTNTKTSVRLHNAIKKYGFESFTCEIIEECIEELLDEREIYWILKFNSTNKNVGYNIQNGGKNSKLGILIFTDEIRRKISIGLMRKHGNFTGILKRDSKKLEKELNKEKGISPIRYNKVSVMCLTNNIIYSSITEAAFNLNLHPNKISDILAGRRKNTGGYTFSKI